MQITQWESAAEERDPVRLHPEYAEYRTRVPMLIPGGSGAVNSPFVDQPEAEG